MANSRKDIGVRMRAKTLKKVIAKKVAGLCKTGEFSEKSRFLNMDYDYKHSVLPLWKKEEYLKLKEKYGEEK